MYSIEKESILYWKLNPNAFKKLNEGIVGFDIQRLGSANKPVNTMLSAGDELRMIMPIVLAADPSSVQSNWDEIVANYWHSLCIEVPAGGLRLQIGFNFTLEDSKRKSYISELIKDKKITSSKELAEYVMGFKKGNPNVPEEEKWKYGVPVNAEQYLWWRYSLINREVANSVIDLNKSPFIRFYLYSDEEQEEIKKQKLDMSKKAIEFYNNITASDNSQNLIENLLYYLMQDQLSIVSNMSDDEKQIKIIDFVKDKPNEFNVAVQDKSLSVKVEVLKFIESGIFRKVSGTNLIVDSTDSSVIIGDGMDNAVSFLKDSKNKEKMDQYRAKMKSLV